MNNTEGLKELLAAPKKIFITTHRKADGDALGSSLALYHYFLKKGHDPVVVSPTDYGMYLHWMPGNDSVIIWENDRDKAKKILNAADIVFCLDFNALPRIEEMAEPIRKTIVPKVMIDHHLEPEGFDNYRLWNPDACATAELIYEFICLMGDVDLIDKDIATCIYTGIVTDSGSFRYANVTPHVHRITAHLIECGVDHSLVHRNVFDTFSENRLRFIGHCLKEKLVVLPDYRSAYITVSKQELKEYEISTGDTEGLVNFPLSIETVNFAVLIVEREGIVKLSLRSKGSFPANEFAKKYFEGGGHLNAAGGKSDVNLEKSVARFIAGLEEYKTLLLMS